jgi:oligopeptide transport system permease protein
MESISKDKFRKVGIDKDLGESMARPRIGYWQDAWRRLKGNKVAMIAIVLLFTICIMTVVGPHINGFKYEEIDGLNKNQKPDSVHWFGTAYFGGKIDTIMMRIVEVLTSVPYLIVVILISIMVDSRGIGTLILTLTLTGWCGMARLVRGQMLQIKQQEYIVAAEALGVSPWKIITKHLIPNSLGVVIVAITFDIPGYIFAESFLSYLGLGPQPPATSWGALASAAQQNFVFHPHQLFFPALMIALTMLSFTLLGDGLRDALDPKLRQ